VRSIIRLASGKLWLGLWNGQIAEQVGEQFQTIESPWPKGEQQAVNVFLNDGQGGVWVGLRQHGVAHFDGRQWRWFDSKTTGAPEFVLGFSKTGSDADPVIWASSKGDGLGRFYKGQWQRFNTWNSELPTDNLIAMSLIVDAQNRNVLWIGTQSHGLIRVDVSNINRPRLVTSPALPKPPHPFVYGAVQNSHGDMMICTDYGAAFWKKIAVNQFHAINYNRDDGLPHDECNAGALSFDRYDRAWIGTIGGAAVHSPESMRTHKATLNLERLSINHQDQNLLNNKLQFTAPSANASIDLEFALFTGERESESRYRTQLIGLDENPGLWLQSNQRSLSNLPSGDYVLKIEAQDYAGIMAKPLEIRLHMQSH
jgi:ligand-binding sensor domain-containing protein